MRTSGASLNTTGKRRRAGVLRKALVAAAALSVGLTLSMPMASAASDDPAVELQTLKDELSAQVELGFEDPTDQLQINNLAAATPDECYKAGGTYEPAQDSGGVYSCTDGRQLKVNQGYVWGMAKHNDTLWFGTGPNVQCLMMAQYIAPIPVETDSFVCDPTSTYRAADKSAWTLELTGSPTWPAVGPRGYLRTAGIAPNFATATAYAGNTIARIGDWRQPDLFTYDLSTGQQKNLFDDLDADGKKWLGRTLGIRSAGSGDGYVIFAGPDVLTAPNGAWGWVNYFVFTDDGQYVGSDHVENQTNIRKWVDINGKLYTGVGVAPTFLNFQPDPSNPVRGQVLKFKGFNATDPQGSRIKYDVVGNMTTSPSEFTEFNNRIYTSSWPVGTSPDTAGIYMSPELNGDGELTSNTAWDKVWDITDYEPDPLIARTMAVGPVQSYDGKIYWGTMNVPFVGSFYLIQAYTAEYGAPDTEQLALMLLGGWRTTTEFRGDNFESSPDVQLLYGNVVLPVADFTGPSPSWSLQRNKMSAIPRYGLAGFGNPFNAYTWTMAVNRGDLYVGTFDSSYLIRSILQDGINVTSSSMPEGIDPADAQAATTLFTPENMQALLAGYGLTLDDLPLQYGADLWRFPTGTHRAVPEFINGGLNRFSYGIRTMISDGSNLYLGMANPMNLEVNPPGYPQGGWQLLQLNPWPTRTKLFAEPNPVTAGQPITFDVSVRPDLSARSMAHGTPWGVLQVYGDDLLLGSCQVFQGHSASCELTTSALEAGEHTFYATFDGTRTWADSRSKDVKVTVNSATAGAAPQTPPAAAPGPQSAPAAGAAPQIAATSIAVGARSQSKALKPLRRTSLVNYVQTNASAVGVRVECVVKGKTLVGSKARKACGITVTKGKAVKVSAKPKCLAGAQIRVGLTAQAQGASQAQWTRTWSVAGKC